VAIKKILIVDDSETERAYLHDILAKKGYDIVLAKSGEEGVEKSKADHPDLIIMDVIMPGLNGFQATRTITRDEATKHIPVIICTTKGQETDKVWGMRQGAVEYMVKPIKEADLLGKITAISR
jgi:twitching motility two-component system response regulator PilH